MIFRVESQEKKQYIGGIVWKERAWTVCIFKSGLGKKGGGVSEGGWYPNAR